MPIKQKIFIIILSISIFAIIIELVRKKRLREEYSWLWLITGFVMIVLSLWYDLLIFISNFVGIVIPASTIFLAGLIFLMLISLHYSIKISRLTDQVKDLSQQISILSSELEHNDTVLQIFTDQVKKNNP